VSDVTRAELEAGLEAIRAAPRDSGVLQLIVRRPTLGGREVLNEGLLDEVHGLVGDNWETRGSSRTEDGSAHPGMQLNIMSSRAIALIARDKTRWPLAGDQLFIDIDLSEANLPPGTRLAVGSASSKSPRYRIQGAANFTSVSVTRRRSSSIQRSAGRFISAVSTRR
jgi:hypothetical protein